MIISANFLFRGDNEPLAQEEIGLIVSNCEEFNLINIETTNAVKCEETGDEDFDNDYNFYFTVKIESLVDITETMKILESIPEFLELNNN